MFVYIEKLSLFTIIYAILLSFRNSRKNKNYNCYYIDATRSGVWALNKLKFWKKLQITQLDFDMNVVRTDENISAKLYSQYDGSLDILNKILTGKAYRSLSKSEWEDSRFGRYIEKSLTIENALDTQPIYLKIYLIEVINWHKNKEKQDRVILLLQKQCWFQSLCKYGAERGVLIKGVSSFNFKQAIRTKLLCFPRISCWIKRYRASGSFRPSRPTISDATKNANKMVVPFNGYRFINDHARYSTLAFWQRSDFPASNLLVPFGAHQPNDFKEEWWKEYHKAGIDVVALISGQLDTKGLPSFGGFNVGIPAKVPKPRFSLFHRQERNMLLAEWGKFQTAVAYWSEFFEQFGAKLYFTEDKYTHEHIAISEALHRLGGVTAVCQRSFEEFSGTSLTIDADIVFGFCPEGVAVERKNGSKITYHVSIGYPGDHRFSLLKERAEKLRKKLQDHGAEKIIAFFDENSGDDHRWAEGHKHTQENYGFLIKQVLENPKLGVIFKPKKPGNLRKRLGEVAKLLEQAEATGRCFLYEESGPSSFPPVGASLSADIAIHGYLWASTAAMESALAGIPTLLLDNKGWHISKLYELGLEKIVFHRWDQLWNKLDQYWKNPDRYPDFGSWEPMLSTMDPFRDGKATERMGTFLHWVLQGFDRNLSKEDALAEAVEKYRASWGDDKVQQLL